MIILRKEPGKEVEMTTINNDLKSLQEAVGGRIETVTVAEDLAVICNEAGLIKNLPHNCKILGTDFYGTVLFAGVDGDEFTDLKVTAMNAARRIIVEAE